jgi:plastocyanin
VAPSLGPTAAAKPSVSPTGLAAPEVKIVEPAFRPPQEWTYSPAEITVKAGAHITWSNTGAVAHTVTADDATSFDSGSIDPKAAFTFTPTAAGTFAYHCTFHPWMKATLVVTPWLIQGRATDGTGALQESDDHDPFPRGATGYYRAALDVRA